jgi:DNA-binding response OmpR family regulator
VPQTILLVDDEFSSLEVLALLIGQEGYEVITASDAEEALARLREKRVDLVITDFWMPGMSGLELFERMQGDEAWRTIPVLLMTAAYDYEAARHRGLAGVMAKPLRFDTVLATIRRVLRTDEPPS